jgi:hypothetical protein
LKDVSLLSSVVNFQSSAICYPYAGRTFSLDTPNYLSDYAFIHILFLTYVINLEIKRFSSLDSSIHTDFLIHNIIVAMA